MIRLAPPDSTDHDMHSAAVSLAAHHDKAAKLLNKALDERHRIAIHHFAKVHTEDEGVRCDVIRSSAARSLAPTGPRSLIQQRRAVIRDTFGEVHMLSHLVGAANRADIRRLCQLEEENAGLRTRLDKLQAAFREAVVTRVTTIQEVRQALVQQVASGSSTPHEHNLVLFPADCISHHAARLAKRLCRQAGKRFIPLRSAGATSLLAAL